MNRWSQGAPQVSQRIDSGIVLTGSDSKSNNGDVELKEIQDKLNKMPEKSDQEAKDRDKEKRSIRPLSQR